MCIFCKIAKREIPTEFVFESENVFVINDINPKAPKHFLVIPKKHVETLNELEDEGLMAELLRAVKNLKLKEYRTVINTGKEAGQEVFHLHLHVLSGRQMAWPPG